MILYLTQRGGEDIFLDVTDTRLYRIYKIIINMQFSNPRVTAESAIPKCRITKTNCPLLLEHLLRRKKLININQIKL